MEMNALNHVNIVPALITTCTCTPGGIAGSRNRTRTGPHLLGTSCTASEARTSGENCICRPSQGTLLLSVPPSGWPGPLMDATQWTRLYSPTGRAQQWKLAAGWRLTAPAISAPATSNHFISNLLTSKTKIVTKVMPGSWRVRHPPCRYQGWR